MSVAYLSVTLIHIDQSSIKLGRIIVLSDARIIHFLRVSWWDYYPFVISRLQLNLVCLNKKHSHRCIQKLLRTVDTSILLVVERIGLTRSWEQYLQPQGLSRRVNVLFLHFVLWICNSKQQHHNQFYSIERDSVQLSRKEWTSLRNR